MSVFSHPHQHLIKWLLNFIGFNIFSDNYDTDLCSQKSVDAKYFCVFSCFIETFFRPYVHFLDGLLFCFLPLNFESPLYSLDRALFISDYMCVCWDTWEDVSRKGHSGGSEAMNWSISWIWTSHIHCIRYDPHSQGLVKAGQLLCPCEGPC